MSLGSGLSLAFLPILLELLLVRVNIFLIFPELRYNEHSVVRYKIYRVLIDLNIDLIALSSHVPMHIIVLHT